jgi:hypothetical protein
MGGESWGTVDLTASTRQWLFCWLAGLALCVRVRVRIAAFTLTWPCRQPPHRPSAIIHPQHHTVYMLLHCPFTAADACKYCVIYIYYPHTPSQSTSSLVSLPADNPRPYPLPCPTGHAVPRPTQKTLTRPLSPRDVPIGVPWGNRARVRLAVRPSPPHERSFGSI